MENMPKTREENIEFVKRRLLQNSFPRVQISIIFLFTALTGFLTSFLLLHLGATSMALRYPIAIAVAYCVFLLLLRVWLWLQNPHSNFNADLFGFDLNDSFSASSNNADTEFEFSGGDFGGGGAGGSWGERVSLSTGGNSLSDGFSFDFDLEELGLIIIAVVAIIGGLLASLYIIYIAPILLAEILVDGILIKGLYNRVKKIEQRYWLRTAVKKTLLPVFLTILFFTVAGLAMGIIAPNAHSIGETWSYISSDRK